MPPDRRDRDRLDRVRRTIVARALEIAGAPDARRQRYHACGRSVWLMWHPADHAARISTNHCWDSLCPRCSRIRQHRLAERLEPFLAHQVDRHRIRHITLTLRSSDSPIRDQVTRLRAAFRRLRQTRRWRDHVAGGAAFIEVTFNARTDQWHPHLHVIAEGKYWAHADLSAAWLRATGDSYVVGIRHVPTDVQRVAGYVAKYASKGCNPLKIPAEALSEWIRGGTRGRLWTLFGSWYHAVPPRTQDADYWDGWERVDSLATLWTAARDGDLVARWLLERAGIDTADADLPDYPPDWLSPDEAPWLVQTEVTLTFAESVAHADSLSRTTPYQPADGLL